MSDRRGARFWKQVAPWLVVAVVSSTASGTAFAGGGTQAEPTDERAADTSPGGLSGLDAWIAGSTSIEDGVAYRLVETVLERGRRIEIEAAYADLGEPGEYRKVWLGGRGTVVDLPRLRLELTAALSKSAGTAAAGERHVQSKASLEARPSADWIVEVSYTDSAPLNDTAVRKHSLDRVRLVYQVGRYRVGAGYAGYQDGRQSWEHRPFVSLSRSVRGLGEAELWLQRIERPAESAAGLRILFAATMSP